MGKLKISGCPRCQKGEVFIDHDLYGWYECCLQCGYIRDLPEITQPVGEEDKRTEIDKARETKVRSLTIKKGV